MYIKYSIKLLYRLVHALYTATTIFFTLFILTVTGGSTISFLFTFITALSGSAYVTRSFGMQPSCPFHLLSNNMRKVHEYKYIYMYNIITNITNTSLQYHNEIAEVQTLATIRIQLYHQCFEQVSHRSSIFEGRHNDHQSSKVNTSIFESRHIDLRKSTSILEGRHINPRSSKVDTSIFEDRRWKHRTWKHRTGNPTSQSDVQCCRVLSQYHLYIHSNSDTRDVHVQSMYVCLPYTHIHLMTIM